MDINTIPTHWMEWLVLEYTEHDPFVIFLSCNTDSANMHSASIIVVFDSIQLTFATASNTDIIK